MQSGHSPGSSEWGSEIDESEIVSPQILQRKDCVTFYLIACFGMDNSYLCYEGSKWNFVPPGRRRIQGATSENKICWPRVTYTTFHHYLWEKLEIDNFAPLSSEADFHFQINIKKIIYDALVTGISGSVSRTRKKSYIFCYKCLVVHLSTRDKSRMFPNYTDRFFLI